MRTLTMSTGWMMQVAPMPDRPPLKKGLAAFQTGLSAAISFGVFRDKGALNLAAAAAG
jgi:hypothetical protein